MEYYIVDASLTDEYDWDFEPTQRGVRLYLPQVYCPHCGKTYTGDFTAPLPEPIPPTYASLFMHSCADPENR